MSKNEAQCASKRSCKEFSTLRGVASCLKQRDQIFTCQSLKLEVCQCQSCSERDLHSHSVHQSMCPENCWPSSTLQSAHCPHKSYVERRHCNPGGRCISCCSLRLTISALPPESTSLRFETLCGCGAWLVLRILRALGHSILSEAF